MVGMLNRVEQRVCSARDKATLAAPVGHDLHQTCVRCARELRMRSRLSSGWPGRRAASTSVGAAAGRVPGPDNAVIHRIQAAGLAAAALAHVEGAAVRVFALFGPAPGAAG